MFERSEGELPSTVRPEMRLLLYLARCHRDPQFLGPIADLLRQTIDWKFLIEAALNHRVYPLFYGNLRGQEWECVSSDLRESLRRLFLTIVARNQLLTAELLHILELGEAHGIPMLPFKGPVLAVRAYGAIALRQFEDLDILMHRDDATRAKEILTADGYFDPYGLTPALEMTVMRYQKHFIVVSPAKKIAVELHWAVEPVTKCLRFCDENIWERPGTVFLDGRNVPNLSAEDTLVLLCLHGTSHCWDRLAWICDVAEHVARAPALNWEFAMNQARDLGCLRMLFLGLHLAREFAGAPLPEDIAAAARCYCGVENLAKRVMQQLIFGPYGPWGTAAALSFRLAARESMRDKLRLLLERFVIPDALDCQFWRLPPKLSFLFFVLRPVRLLIRSFIKD